MSFLSVITTAWLLSTVPVDPVSGRPLDGIERDVSGRVATLSWRDADDALDGFMDPAIPVEGQPFEVNLRIRPLAGSDFDGPVVLTVRRVGQEQGTSVTVAPESGRWRHRFTLEDSGAYQLDVGFRSTRMKVIHGSFEVQSNMTVGGVRLSTVGLVVVAILGAAAIGYSLIRVLRGRKPQPS